MTTDELNATEPGTLVYLPNTTGIDILTYSGPVHDSHFYSFSSVADYNGLIVTKRPTYYHFLDLLPATTNQANAWDQVLDSLIERIVLVNKMITELNNTNNEKAKE